MSLQPTLLVVLLSVFCVAALVIAAMALRLAQQLIHLLIPNRGSLAGRSQSFVRRRSGTQSADALRLLEDPQRPVDDLVPPRV